MRRDLRNPGQPSGQSKSCSESALPTQLLTPIIPSAASQLAALSYWSLLIQHFFSQWDFVFLLTYLSSEFEWKKPKHNITNDESALGLDANSLAGHIGSPQASCCLPGSRDFPGGHGAASTPANWVAWHSWDPGPLHPRRGKNTEAVIP